MEEEAAPSFSSLKRWKEVKEEEHRRVKKKGKILVEAQQRRLWNKLRPNLRRQTKGIWPYNCRLRHISRVQDGAGSVIWAHKNVKTLFKESFHFCFVFLLHFTLYRAVKQTFPTDVDSIVKNRRVTSNMGSGSQEQFVGIQTSVDFCPIGT